MVYFFRMCVPSPPDERFAFPLIATGTYLAQVPHCRKCGRALAPRKRAGELVIEWGQIDDDLPIANEVADFYLVSSDSQAIASKRLCDFLVQRKSSGVEFAPVQIAKYQPPQGKSNKAPPRFVPLTVPVLRELKVTGRAGLDLLKNGFEVSEHLKCQACQHVFTLLLRPSEKRSSPWVLSRQDWDNSEFFQIHHPTLDRAGWNQSIFVTEAVKNDLESQDFTNLKFDLFGFIE